MELKLTRRPTFRAGLSRENPRLDAVLGALGALDTWHWKKLMDALIAEIVQRVDGVDR
jgi:hypothetical protein